MNATPVALYEAPQEMHDYLAKLKGVTGYKGPIGMGLIAPEDMPTRAGVSDNPDGFLRISLDRPPLIVVRRDIEEARWQFIVAHEFLHALRWAIDEYVLRQLPDSEHEAYMGLVEDTMKPLTILLMVGGMVNAEWVDED